MSGFGTTSVEEVRQRLGKGDEVLVVDVRERDEWDAGRIPGAVHVPLSEFVERAPELVEERDREVVAYCLSGGRSSRAAQVLAGMGHPRVLNLDGGIEAWGERGGRIVADRGLSSSSKRES
jgi:rhodanese-related sulfurtransferase